MARASSPPEATRASGWTGSPGLAPRRKRTAVAGAVAVDRHLEPGPGHGQVGQALLATAAAAGPRPDGPRRARPRPPASGPGRAAARPRGPGRGRRRPRARPGAAGPRRRRPPPRPGWPRTCGAGRPGAAPGLDLGQPLGVVLPGLDDRPQVAGHVAQLGQAARSRATAGERRRPARAPRRPGQQVEGAAPATPRRPAPPGPRRRPRGGPTGRPGGSSSAASAVVLVGVVHAGRGDLRDLIAEDVGLAGPLVVVAADRGQPRLEVREPGRAATSAARGRRRRRRRGPRAGPPGGQSDWWSCWPWMSTSPAPASDRADTGASRPSTQARERPPPGPSGPAPPRARRRRRRRPGARSGPRPGPRPHRPAPGPGRPAPQHQGQGLDDQGLAGPGLPGQGGHARSEADGEVLDDPEVAHPQLGQHAAGSLRRPGPARWLAQEPANPRSPNGHQPQRVGGHPAGDTSLPGQSRPILRPSMTSTAGPSAPDRDRDHLVGWRTRLRSNEEVGATGVRTIARSRGREERAAGREVVGGGAGRGGHQHARRPGRRGRARRRWRWPGAPCGRAPSSRPPSRSGRPSAVPRSSVSGTVVVGRRRELASTETASTVRSSMSAPPAEDPLQRPGRDGPARPPGGSPAVRN